MIERFRPDKYYESIFNVNFRKLADEGIKVVACDLDNTLVPHDVALASEEVKYLIEKVQSFGLIFILVSNNHKARVEKFAASVGVKYYYGSKKPLPFVFKRILKDYQITKEQLVLVGDQIMTDVFGANSFGIQSILVMPLAARDILYTKVNRIMEKRVVKNLEKKNLFKIGEYYD